MASKNRIACIKLLNPVQFFGVSGNQLSPSQGGGLEFVESNRGVTVTSKSYPGKSVVVFNSNIVQIMYEEIGDGT